MSPIGVRISLVSFPQALNAFLNGDTFTGVAWLSQSFLQLVLLPILMVGQNVIAAAQKSRNAERSKPSTDIQLQRALDLVTSISIYETKAAAATR